ILQALIDNNASTSIIANINKFKGINHQDIILKLLEADKTNSIGHHIALKLDDFEGLDQATIDDIKKRFGDKK
ncbi:hypothetical protein K8R42_00815, partial [bacterium]|nr:hypothetical protein [bacterium]